MDSNSQNLNTQQICRTCLKDVGNSSQTFRLDLVDSVSGSDRQTTAIGSKLAGFLPEIDFHITPNAIICDNCCAIVNATDLFIKRCLEIEHNMRKFKQKIDYASGYVDLKQFAEEMNNIKNKLESLEVVEEIKTIDCSPCKDAMLECVIKQEKLELEIVNIDCVAFNTDFVDFPEIILKDMCNTDIKMDDCNNCEERNERCDSENEPIGNELDKSDEENINEDRAYFNCSECEYIATGKIDLNNHKEKHTPSIKSKDDDLKASKQLYQCNECTYKTRNRSAFVVHTKTHLNSETYNCNKCNYQTKIKKRYNAHEKIHRAIKHRALCNSETNSKRNQSHLNMHEKKKSLKCKTSPKTSRVKKDVVPYKCEKLECSFSTRYKNAFMRHINSHFVEKPFGCTKCGFTAGEKGILDYHMIMHDGNKCNICNKIFSSKNYLNIHVRQHLGEEMYKCDLCSYRTLSKNSLLLHKANQKHKPLECLKCDYQTNRKCNLNLHMRRHSELKPFKCNQCEYSCKQSTHLKRHILAMHVTDQTKVDEVKIHNCKLCNYKTSSTSAMAHHTRTHTGEKPFKCKLCSYCTTQNSHLTMHMKRHTGEKPFKCSECPYRANSSNLMKLHMRVHTGERPYPCPHCDYRGTQPSSLKMHLRRHSSNNYYHNCTQCHYKTIYKQSLVSHVKRVHDKYKKK